jgi:hypothetical protein
MNTAGMIEVEEIRQLLSHLHGEITVLDNNVQCVRSILRKLSLRAAQQNPDEARALSRFFAASERGTREVETLEQLWEKIAREYERLIGTDESAPLAQHEHPTEILPNAPSSVQRLLNQFFEHPVRSA